MSACAHVHHQRSATLSQHTIAIQQAVEDSDDGVRHKAMTMRAPGALRETEAVVHLYSSSAFEQADMWQLTRVHEPSYVQMVAAAASRMATNPPHSPVPLTPMVQEHRGAARKDPTTSDTRLSPGSYAAARRACVGTAPIVGS